MTTDPMPSTAGGWLAPLDDGRDFACGYGKRNATHGLHLPVGDVKVGNFK